MQEVRRGADRNLHPVGSAPTARHSEPYSDIHFFLFQSPRKKNILMSECYFGCFSFGEAISPTRHKNIIRTLIYFFARGLGQRILRNDCGGKYSYTRGAPLHVLGFRVLGFELFSCFFENSSRRHIQRGPIFAASGGFSVMAVYATKASVGQLCQKRRRRPCRPTRCPP